MMTWLRRRIHPYCWGRSDRYKRDFRQTTRRQILGFFQARRLDLPGGYLPRLTNQLMMAHFAGGLILYFQGDGRTGTPEILVCLDIDCHDKGTYEGACVCVKWLIDNGFPGLFWSKSTNGRGIHAYLRVDKAETNARGLDEAIRGLERWLKYQLCLQKWDVEDIEVKGRPPILDWGDERYELLGVRMGSLAKLPVDALDRPVELMNTTLKRVDELRCLGGGVPSEPVHEGEENDFTTYSVSILSHRSGQPVPSHPDEVVEPEFVPNMRNREWPLWVEAMSKHGLREEDSMGQVVFELAKWLLWVELFDEVDKVTRTTGLLRGYVARKHNGFVTRIINGQSDEVLAHVERIVDGALDQSPESKELFCRVRQRRDQGKYQRVIRIAPILGEGCLEDPGEREEYCTTYSVSILHTSDEPLPSDVESRIVQFARGHRMQLRDGVYPILRFARRLLNHLWSRHGSARIHRDTLAGWAGNINQQNRYKKILLGLGLLEPWEGTYRCKAASSMYRMSRVTRGAFEERFRNRSQAGVG